MLFYLESGLYMKNDLIFYLLWLFYLHSYAACFFLVFNDLFLLDRIVAVSYILYFSSFLLFFMHCDVLGDAACENAIYFIDLFGVLLIFSKSLLKLTEHYEFIL